MAYFDQLKLNKKKDYYLKNREKYLAYSKKYRETHKVELYRKFKLKMKDTNYWWAIKYYWLRRYFNGSGVCIRCGEYYPFVLENHHIFKKSKFQITLCANCHALMDRFAESDNIWNGDN